MEEAYNQHPEFEANKIAERIQEGQRIAVIGEPELRELLERAEAGAPVEDDVDPPAVLDDTTPVSSIPPEPVTAPPEPQVAPKGGRRAARFGRTIAPR